MSFFSLVLAKREDIAFIIGSSVNWETSTLTYVIECVRWSLMVMRKMRSSTFISKRKAVNQVRELEVTLWPSH
jgi:hypothetical protein